MLKAHPVLKFQGTVQCRFSHLGMCSGICLSTHCQLGSMACCSEVTQQSDGTPLFQYVVCAKNIADSPPGFVPLKGVWVTPPVPAPGPHRCSSRLKRRGPYQRQGAPGGGKSDDPPGPSQPRESVIPSPSLILTWRTDVHSWYELSEVRCASCTLW